MIALLLNLTLAGPILVEDVKSHQMLVPSCDLCAGGTMQWMTTLTITMNSCRKFSEQDFEVEIEDRVDGTMGNSERTHLEVTLKNTMGDCRGPLHRHRYFLTLPDVELKGEVVLENKSLLKL